MKYTNIVLVVILFVLLAYGFYSGYQNTHQIYMLDHGGYIYDASGNITGLWDGGSYHDNPIWIVSLFIYLFTAMPFWWYCFCLSVIGLLVVVNIYLPERAD